MYAFGVVSPALQVEECVHDGKDSLVCADAFFHVRGLLYVINAGLEDIHAIVRDLYPELGL